MLHCVLVLCVCARIAVTLPDDLPEAEAPFTWLGRIRDLKASSPLVKTAAVISCPDGNLIVDAGGFGASKEEMRALGNDIGERTPSVELEPKTALLDGVRFTFSVPATVSGVSDEGDGIFIARSSKTMIIVICEGDAVPLESQLAAQALATELDDPKTFNQ